MDIFTLNRGSTPLLLSFPHVGTELPDDIAARLTPQARAVADTDWHLPQLYAFARELGASMLIARYSRYVIDLNRPPENTNLYPGQDTTGLVPLDTFRKEPLYRPGDEPSEAEVARRRERYWRPYHEALAAELARLRAEHGVALLWDAHSIAPVLPRFFEGRLTDLNLGTADGASCAPQLQQAVADVLAAQRDYTWVVNGRFKGGYITRHYGRPAEGTHALQLEMGFGCYMDEEAPYAYRSDCAARVQPVLRAMLDAVLAAGQALAR